MKKQRIITLLVCLLIVGSGAGVLLWPRTVPLAQCSEVYRLYVNNPSIRASFIKDFRINDTVSVDVTLLEATDSVGWNKLVEELNLVTPDSASQCDLDKGMDLIFLKQVKKDNYSQKAITPFGNVDVLATSYLKKKVAVFHTKNRNEKYSVFHYNYDISTNQ